MRFSQQWFLKLWSFGWRVMLSCSSGSTSMFLQELHSITTQKNTIWLVDFYFWLLLRTWFICFCSFIFTHMVLRAAFFFTPFSFVQLSIWVLLCFLDIWLFHTLYCIDDRMCCVSCANWITFLYTPILKCTSNVHQIIGNAQLNISTVFCHHYITVH